MKLTEEEKQHIIERREKQRKDGKTISFSEYINNNIDEEDINPNDIDDACIILREASEIEGCENGEVWDVLVDFAERYKDYISIEFHNAVKKEIKDLAKELIETGEVKLEEHSATLVNWGA